MTAQALVSGLKPALLITKSRTSAEHVLWRWAHLFYARTQVSRPKSHDVCFFRLKYSNLQLNRGLKEQERRRFAFLRYKQCSMFSFLNGRKWIRKSSAKPKLQSDTASTLQAKSKITACQIWLSLCLNGHDQQQQCCRRFHSQA
jgi:hypothetical protein